MEREPPLAQDGRGAAAAAGSSGFTGCGSRADTTYNPADHDASSVEAPSGPTRAIRRSFSASAAIRAKKRRWINGRHRNIRAHSVHLNPLRTCEMLEVGNAHLP